MKKLQKAQLTTLALLIAQSSNLWSKVMKNAMDRGLMCYPSQGTADGQKGDHVILAPPYIISEAQCDQMIEILAESIDVSL